MGTKVEEKDVMKGGLGGTDDGGGEPAGGGKKKEEPAAAQTVSVGGVEFPAELGGKLQSLVDGFTREIEHLKGQVQTLSVTSIPAKGSKKEEPEDDDDDINTKIFENPKEAINKVLAKFEKKIVGMIAESSGKIEAKQAAASQEKEFWNLFYGDNPELKEHDFIVKALLQRDFAKLGTKTVDEAIKHIATEAKKILLKMPKGGDDDGKGKSRGVEGAGSRAAPGGKPAQEEGEGEGEVTPDTLSGFLKKRRADRRSGAAKGA